MKIKSFKIPFVSVWFVYVNYNGKKGIGITLVNPYESETFADFIVNKVENR